MPDNRVLQEEMLKSDYFRNSESSIYFDNYNIGMCKIDNALKQNIDNGLLPISEETPFD